MVIIVLWFVIMIFVFMLALLLGMIDSIFGLGTIDKAYVIGSIAFIVWFVYNTFGGRHDS